MARGVFNRVSARERSPKFPIAAIQDWRALASILSVKHTSGINFLLRHKCEAATTGDLVVACNELVCSCVFKIEHFLNLSFHFIVESEKMCH